MPETPSAPVEAVAEPEELDEETKSVLNFEQQQFEIATMQAQNEYLSKRVAALAKENHELKNTKKKGGK